MLLKADMDRLHSHVPGKGLLCVSKNSFVLAELDGLQHVALIVLLSVCGTHLLRYHCLDSIRILCVPTSGVWAKLFFSLFSSAQCFALAEFL